MIKHYLSIVIGVFIAVNASGQCGYTVSLGATQNACSGANITISATVSGASGSVSYAWTGPTGATLANTSASLPLNLITSAQAGSYTCSVTVSGCANPVSGIVLINVANVFTINAGSAIVACSGNTINLNATTSAPGTFNYSWTGPNGFTSSTEDPAIANPTANNSGTYTVTATSGGCSATNNVLLSITNLYTVNAGINFVACAGSTANFNASVNPTGSYTYSWTGPNGFASNVEDPIIASTSTNTSGNYTLTVTSGGCTVSDVVNVTFISLSVLNPDAYFPGTNNYLDPPTIYNNLLTYTICGSNSVSSISLENIIPVTNNNSTIYYLQWGNSPQVIFNNVITKPISIGNNPFTISATYNGCQVSTNYNIYVGSNPYVSIGVGNSTGLCPGQSIIANITPVNQQGQQNSPGTIYDLYYSNNPISLVQTFTDLTSTTATNQYFFNQNSCGLGTSNTCYPNQPNVYYAYVVATNACESSCASSPAITINEKPDANFTVSQEFICPNTTITITNTGTNGSTISGNATSGYTCNNTTKIKYLITPNTGFNIVSGNLGGTSGNFNSWTGTNSVVLNFTTAGTYNIVQYAQSNNCGLDSIVKTVCVINPPVCSFSLNTNSGCTPLVTNSTNTTIAPTCSGTAVPMAYSWSITNPINGTSDIINSNSVNPNFTFTNNGTVPLNFTVQLTSTPLNPVTNQPLSCFTTCTQTVTVNPRPLMTSVNAATICSGTALNIPLTSNITSSFSWIATSNTFISGESLTLQNTNIINDNLANLSSTSQQLIYTVTPTSSIGCVGIPQTVTVTLNSVTPGVIAGNQTICVNGNPIVFSVTTAATGAGTVIYQWQSSTDNINWNTIGSATAATYDPPAPASVTTYYRRIVTYTLNGLACSETSNVLTVTVNSIMPGTIAANQTICSGGDPAALSFSAAATGSGTLSYQWQSSTTSVSAGFTNISGATAATFDPLVGISIATFYQLITTSTLNTIGCPANSNPISITINTISPGVISANQTICSGGDPAAFVANTAASGNGNISYQWQSSSDNVVWTNIASATNIAYDPPSSSTTIYYRRIATNTLNTIQCSAISNVVIVTVLQDPSIVTEPLATQSICVGAIIPSSLNVTFTNGTGNATYQWYVSGTPNTAISGANFSNFLPSVFNTAGTYNYFVSVSMNGVGCDVATSQQATIVVLADPTVTAPASAAYCQNASPVAPLSIAVTGGLGTISYQWYSNTNNSSSNGTLISQATLATFTPPVSSVGTMYYYCIVSQTGVNCAVTSQIATIQTTLAPVVSTQPLANQTICMGGTASTLTVTISNGNGTPTYQWYSNTTNANFGGTSINGEITASYSPSGNTIGTTYYYCVISFATGGCSVITSQTAAVIVNPDPIISTQPLATQTICVGGPITTPLSVSYSGGTGTVSYQWFVAGTTNTSIAGATSISYSPITFATAGTFNYLVELSMAGSGCNTVTSQQATIVVLADPTVTAPTSAAYCQNASPVAPLSVAVTGGIGTISYQWYSNTSNLSSNGTLISQATVATFTPPVSSVGTMYYYCIVSQTGVNCAVTSQIATIQTTLAPVVSTQPLANQTICMGGTAAILTLSYSNGTGTPTYQWYSNTTNANFGGTSINGETTSSYSPSGNSIGTTYYYCLISFATGGCSVITSQTAAVIVNPDPIISTQPLATQTICVGGPITTPLSVSYSGGTGTVSYQWFVAGTTNTSIAGATSISYSPITFATAGTFNYLVELSMAGSGCNTVTSQQATIVVLADPTVTAPTSAAYCQNASPVAPLSIAVTGGLGTISYQWYSNTSNLSSNGTLIPQATLATFTPPVSSVGTMYYYCIVSQTGVNCAVTSQIATIQTTLAPVVSAQPLANQTICMGGTASALTLSYSNGTGTPTYQWYSNTTNANFGGTSINGETTSSYSPSGNSIGTTYYYCVISFTTGGCSVITSQTAAVIVNPDPIISTQPVLTQTICQGTSIPVPMSVSYSGGAGGATYQWYTNNGTTLINNALLSSYTPGVINTPGTYSYLVIVTLSGNGCETAASQPAEIIVNPIPTVNPIPLQNFCNSLGTNEIVISGTTPGANFNWINSNPANGLTPNGVGNIPVFTATNPTSSPLVSTITVSPSYTNAGATCFGINQTFTITINPTPNLNLPSNIIVCNGSQNPAINFTGTATSYTWTNTTTSIGLSASGLGNIPAFISVNPLIDPVIATITAIPYYSVGTANCTGLEQTFSITVNPTPIVNDLPNQFICNGFSTNPILFTGSGTSYTWQNSIITIGINASGIGDIPSFTALNPSNLQMNSLITVTPQLTLNSMTCAGPAQTIELNINPTPSITQPSNIVLCNSAPSGAINFGGTGTSYTWTNTNSSIGIGASGTGNIPSFNGINTGILPVSSTVTVTPVFASGGTICTGEAKIFTIVINPTPTLTDPSDITVCNGSSTTPVILSGTGTSYTWINSLSTIGLSGTGTGDIPTFTGINLSTSPVIASVTITPQYSNANLTCSGPIQVFTITVNPAPVVTFSIPNQTICSEFESNSVLINSATPGTSITWSASTVPNSISGLTTVNGGNTIPQFTLTNNGSLPASVTIIAIATTGGSLSCPGAGSTYTITVNPTPTVTDPQNQVICNGTSTASIAFSGSGTSYTWINNQNSIGLVAAGTSTIPPFTAVNNTNTTVISTVTVTPQYTNNAITCPGSAENFTITVNYTPTINLISDVTNCANTLTQTIVPTGTGTSYSWVNSSPIIGLISSGTGNVPSFTTINNSSTPISSTVAFTPIYTNNGVSCEGLVENYLITVNPKPMVAIPIGQTICNTASTQAINFTGTGTSYTWTNSVPSIGLSTAGIGNIIPFNGNNTTSTPIIASLSVTPQFTGGTITCLGDPESFSITVNPTPSVFASSNQVVCNGASISQINFTGTGTAYTWVNNNPSIGLSASGTGTINPFTAINTGLVPVLATITVTPIYNGNNVNCTGPSQSFTITINPTPAVLQPTNQVLCNNTASAAIVFNGNGTSYSWTNTTPSIGIPLSGSGNIASFTSVNATNTPIVATITVVPDFVGGSASCAGVSQSFLFTINPTPIVNTVMDQFLCNGSSTSAINFTGTGTGYAWTNSAPSIGLVANGTGNIGAFTATNTSTTLLTGSILISPQYSYAGLTCNGLSQTITINVSPMPYVVDPTDVVICNGAPSQIDSFTGNGTSYSWINNNPSIGLPVSGNGNVSSFICSNPGTTPIVATLTVLPDYTIDGITCTGPNQTFTITVNPTPTVSPISNQTICNGSSTQAISFIGTGNTYTWTNSLISVGIGGNGTGTIPVFTGINTTSIPTTGNFSVTPEYLNAGLTCSGPQQTFSITINPTPVVNDPPDFVVCNGTVIPITPFTGTGTYYSWTNSIPSIGLGSGANGSIPSFTAQNNSNSLQQVAQLSVIAFFDQGGALCAGNQQNFTFTINPTTILTDPVNQEICNTTQTSAVNFVGTGTSYSWFNSNTLIGLALNGLGNIPAFTAINTTAVQDQATVVVTPIYTSLNGLSCPGTPQDFTYSINPSPLAIPVADFAICNGATINVPLSANILSNFTWYANPNTDVAGDVNFPQPSLIVSNTLTNNSMAMQFITYHILPTSSPEGCLGLESTFVVQVVPYVEMTSIATAEICSGAFVNIALTANIPASFLWLASDNPNVTGENTLQQSGTSISDFLINTTTQNQLVIYSIIPTSLAAGCVGEAQTIAVLVRPPLALISDDTISICSDNLVNLTFQANASASFNWFANDNQLVQGESTSVQNSSTILDDLVNATNAIQQVDYTVVATSIINGCSSPIFNVTVFVNPLPVGIITPVEICTGETTSIPLAASIPSQFSWVATSNPVVLGETIQQQNTATIVNTLIHNALAAQLVNYTVTPVSMEFGCIGNPFTIPVTVHPLPIVSFNTSGSITCNLIPVTFNNTSQGILDYAWNFGDNATSFDVAPTHTYPLLGPYTVTLVGTNPITGCFNTFVQNVSLSESPEVDFIVSADEGCVVLDVTFADMVNDPNTTLLWNFGDGETSFQPNIVDHQYTDPGCYDVSLTVTNAAGCFITETQTEMVCVYAIPDALFTVSQDYMPTSEPVFEFTNLSTNAYTYLWDFGNFTTSTATNPIQTYNATPAEYVITLHAYSQFGCYDSMMLTVAVTEDLLYYVPNTFTPNGDGTNDIFLPVLTAGFDPKSYTLLIFNRWGEILFESHDPAVGWDGKYKPMLQIGTADIKLNPCDFEGIMQDGTYTWKIQFTGLQNESAFEFVGHVNLLR